MDTEDLLKSLKDQQVEFVIIGATAFPVYGYVRATLDIDIFIRPTEQNAKSTIEALVNFGYDMSEVKTQDLITNKILIRQYAVETDIHPFVKGTTFETVWNNRVKSKFGDTEVFFASLKDLIVMKEAAGRTKDKEDLKYLIKLKENK